MRQYVLLVLLFVVVGLPAVTDAQRVTDNQLAYVTSNEDGATIGSRHIRLAGGERSTPDAVFSRHGRANRERNDR